MTEKRALIVDDSSTAQHHNQIPTAAGAEPTKPEKQTTGKTVSILLIVLLIMIAFVIINQRGLNQALLAINTQQGQQQQQLAGMESSLLNIQAEQIEQLQRHEALQASLASDEIPTINQWADFVWAFNQSSAMPFSPRLLDPDIAVKLHEFVNRLSRQGFSGTLYLDLSFGNFCVVMNSAGQAQLPDSDVQLAECMLFSELYPFESMAEQAVADLNAALMNIEAVRDGEITIAMSPGESRSTPYPGRESQIPASDWNTVARANNQLGVSLRRPQADGRPVINERGFGQ